MKIPQHLQPFLSKLQKGLERVLENNLVGIYTHGSLSYGGVCHRNPHTQTIDFNRV